MTEFHKLNFNGTCYKISVPKPYHKQNNFSPEIITTVFNFAYNMTFGGIGQHRSHRSNGDKYRKPGEIFANTFQGKLAECAVLEFLRNLNVNIDLDFSEKKLGYWDQSDIDILNKKIAIKSTKSYGNLLLLECSDWNINAQYIPNLTSSNSIYDYFIMVRIKPYCEEIMKSNRCLYSFNCDRKILASLLQNKEWEYEISGFITHSDLKEIIRNELVIQKGSYLNTTKMDTNNYYIQLGDLRSPSELLNDLLLLKEKKNANL